MTTKTSEFEDAIHSQVFPLLAGFDQGALNPEDTLQVAGHVAGCAQCQDELVRLERLASAFASRGEPEWRPSAGSFDSLMSLVDDYEGAQNAARPARRASWRQRLGDYLDATPIGMRWTLGLESAALAALVMILILPGAPLPSNRDGVFETLTTPVAESTRARQRVKLVFDDNATAGAIRALLQAVGGQIVTGPSPVGVYVAEIGDDMATSTVQILRASPAVRLAEPVK